MKKLLNCLIFSQALAIGLAAAGPRYTDPYALEPSINGGDSARGLFATQAEEDAYDAERLALELEPCINGGVSAGGRFASQIEEDIYYGRLAGN